MSTLCEAQVKELVKDSYAVKERKKDHAKSETGQVAKDVASFLCRGTRGIKIPISGQVSVCRIDTTCDDCGDRSGEAYIINGKKLCRTCKRKSEAKK